MTLFYYFIVNNYIFSHEHALDKSYTTRANGIIVLSNFMRVWRLKYLGNAAKFSSILLLFHAATRGIRFHGRPYGTWADNRELFFSFCNLFTTNINIHRVVFATNINLHKTVFTYTVHCTLYCTIQARKSLKNHTRNLV